MLAELDRRQTAQADGCKTLVEWTTSRLDVDNATASRLVETSRTIKSDIADALMLGTITFDRAHATSRLAASGIDDALNIGANHDVMGVRRLSAARNRHTSTDEAILFEDRCYAAQPNLDNTGGRFWGQMAGLAWTTLDAAIRRRADALPALPDGTRDTLRHRMADTLSSIAEDSLGATNGGDTPVHRVTAFIDANGATAEGGIRIGPNTLDELLCSSPVEVIDIGALDGIPRVARAARREIPGATRKFVLARDKVCTADGCSSSYRLQPHHIGEYAKTRNHQPDDLASVCWYHHQVVIHQRRYTIDPQSPPNRRRFIPPRAGPLRR